MKRLEVRFEEEVHKTLEADSAYWNCTKSDIARAAMKLGLKALENGADATGLPVAHWIAALNGKVKK